MFCSDLICGLPHTFVITYDVLYSMLMRDLFVVRRVVELGHYIFIGSHFEKNKMLLSSN